MSNRISEDRASVSSWRATGQEEPIFFDASGHRGRLMRILGGLSGAASAGALSIIVTGMLGFASVPGPHPRSPAPLLARVVPAVVAAVDHDPVRTSAARRGAPSAARAAQFRGRRERVSRA